jgi:hypothetical protein
LARQISTVADLDAVDLPASAQEAAYVSAFARFHSRNVAAGDPADDTRATYALHVAIWLAWSRGVDLDVGAATSNDVEGYRKALISAGCLPTTTAIKLKLVRRLYDAAIRAGLRGSNPAVGVSVPRGKRAVELLADSRVVLGGASAARVLSWELTDGSWPVEAYVAETHLVALMEKCGSRTGRPIRRPGDAQRAGAVAVPAGSSGADRGRRARAGRSSRRPAG